MRLFRLVVFALLTCVLGLAACSSGDGAGPTSTANSPVTTPSEASSAEPSTGPNSASTSEMSPPPTTSTAVTTTHTPTPTLPTSTTTKATATSTSASTGVPLPPGLSPTQKASATKALATYSAFIALANEASSEPGKDWSKQAAAVAAAPIAGRLVQAWKGDADQGIRTVGDVVVYPRVTKVTSKGGEVTISSCVDHRGVKTLDKTGEDITAPDAKGSYRVHPSTTVITKFGDQFLVSQTTNDLDQQCVAG